MKLSEKTRQLLASVQKDLHLENPHQTPKLDKVIVAVWIGSLATRKGMKDFSEVEKNLQKITGQKPALVVSKKAISNFKLREWLPVMLRVTLRGQKAYDFLSKMIKIILPRVRDFVGLSKKSFDTTAWYSVGVKTYSIFPELHPDEITTDVGLQVSIRTSSNDPKQVQTLLESMGAVFQWH